MIRLPSNHAAITAPLIASNTSFPGIPIGRSLLDGRAFHLSPVLTNDAILPSTNSLALGGLGSGKSTTAKTRARREILDNAHQYVVIDSFGEDSASGEWAPLARSLGGRVIEAGSFTLNPVSELFPREVREQLVRSLIAAVEPSALTYQATHALQHALAHPKATSLTGVVDALVAPEDGRWSAAKLTEWGEGPAIALSRYTEGSLTGLFDGQDASLPETDLPILSFDFSRLDRNSPAIPSLMAAISCWAEHVWLRQSTAVHRHLVLEEAWQILLSPATSELIQRLLKNSRKAALSMDVVMHTLSDLGEGKAQDLAKLCEIAHVGRLGPEEAAIVGALLGLPQWAIDTIPGLAPGQAVWKVGPDYTDVVQTVLAEEEIALTDTSSRRRQAQQALVRDLAVEQDVTATTAEPVTEPSEDIAVDPGEDLHAPFTTADDTWDWESLPPNVVGTLTRHESVLQAAMDGRFDEASQLATLYEREDIAVHGLNSTQALAWWETRAQVAELRGEPGQAVQLRATVAHMGNDDAAWFEKTGDSTSPQWHRGPQPYAPEPQANTPQPQPRTRRRTWPYVAAVAALGITIAGVYQYAADDEKQQERQEKAAAYKGRSGAAVQVDGVSTDVIAQWNSDRDRVYVELRSYFDRNAKYLRIDSSGQSAYSTRKDGWYPKDPQIALPVTDPLADITVRIAVGGKTWKNGARAQTRTIRLSPTGIAYDGETGERLPRDN
ncbi:hypothetical protein [Streptomyces canus]|uniref:hypothetical protein n=1 Tax=Streptomyces canus TaxID=58343 RepID=UPI002DD96EFC|nr:hypothetical protein [Streptomyces canus]WSD82902.1 hypothetical protein OG925_00350 [Streptomyces canus]WSD91932.1 hypothetical protein OG925_50130 [Streptomyces canus]WSD92579.1 hypothetical protein OG925_50830 [Streptomyces canus]